MRRLFSIFLILISYTCFSQQIETIKKNRYQYKGETLTLSKTKELAKNHSEASFKIYKKVSRNYWTSYFFAGTGGALIGFYVADKIKGEDIATTPILITGLGLIGISIPLSIKSQKATKEFVDHYNSNLKAKLNDPQLKLNLSGSSIGLSINF